MNEKISQKLEFEEIKKMLAGRARSESGRQLAYKLMPEKKERAVKRLIDETREAQTIELSSESSPMSSFTDIASERARLR